MANFERSNIRQALTPWYDDDHPPGVNDLLIWVMVSGPKQI